MKKKIISVIVAIFIIITFLSFSSDTYAVEDPCGHNSMVLRSDSYSYTEIGTSSHHTHHVLYYECTICGHDLIINENYYEAHTYNIPYSYTGNNYHSGTRHYFQYKLKCKCEKKSTQTGWQSGYCPGGSNHIEPLSILPIGTETE